MSAANAPDPPSLHHEKYKTWTRDGFMISTDPSLISIQSLTSAFAQDWMYWATPLPPDAMKAMVDNSLCFALYTPTPQQEPGAAAATTSDPVANLKISGSRPAASRANSTGTSMIGFARVVTDQVTIAFLTDVYVLPEWQGEGLGKWLIECVQETFEELAHLRRTFLVTSRDGPAVGFYEKLMKMEKVEGVKLVAMSWRGPGSVV